MKINSYFDSSNLGSVGQKTTNQIGLALIKFRENLEINPLNLINLVSPFHLWIFYNSGCIELRGPLPQQIKQLRARERELLSDVEKLETTVKKLKEDRSHYRKMTDDYRYDTRKRAILNLS